MSYQIAIKTWDESHQTIRALREKVFVLEWQIPSKLEFDENDPLAHHLLVSDNEGNIIATARITHSGEIGRIAVRSSHRSLALYKTLFDHLLSIAKQHEIEKVTVRCNLDGVADMRQQGFQPTGRVFMEAGIPMQRLCIPTAQQIKLPDIRLLH